MNISTYTINHFGIIAATCKELDIAGIIDDLIPLDPQQKVSTGQAAVAMIINGLGFSNRRLYLFPQFFQNKPIDLLLNKNITTEDLNDDSIGRALDKMFNYGCTELFAYISHNASEIAQVNKKFGHMDTTTFSVHGEYELPDDENTAIHITYGNSKAKRPDLKQLFFNMIVSSDGGIPLFMQALNGNSSDTTVFRKTVTDFRKGIKMNLQEILYWVADCKFYTKKTIQALKYDVLWISRVPDNIKEAKQCIDIAASSLNELILLRNEGYSYRKFESNYADVKQRWIVIHSQKKEAETVYSIKKSVKQEFKQIEKKIKKLKKREFESEDVAKKSLSLLQKKSKFHNICLDYIETKEKYLKKGRPSKNKNKEKKIIYFIHSKITVNEKIIDLEIKRRAIFIVATNELSEQKLSDQEVFDNYKGQGSVEKGFRFLKDPLFFASSLFLKKPKRIVALTMIMCLSLLVYSICERKLRNLLKEYGHTIMNQIKKPTQKPTLKWIFQLFEDVHLIKIENNNQVKTEIKNLRPEGIKALNILGKNYMKPYLLA